MVLLFILFINSTFLGQPVDWALTPSLSPDGNRIAFSFHGDLWVAYSNGGLAIRMTASDGFEGTPIWSPDGKWICYLSDESGNSEIYIVPSDGSAPPERLTYHPAYEMLLAFSEDSKFIYFSSSMYDFRGGVYRISIKGGNPEKVFDFEVNSLAQIDGTRFLIERGNEPWYRKGYRGPADREIWAYDAVSKKFTRLTNNDLRDTRPMYSSKTGKIYFLSNRADNGITNLFEMDITGRNVKQLTNFDEEINWASISQDGSRIVMESLGRLYIYDCVKGELIRPDIRVVEDFDPKGSLTMSISDNITDFSISPDGKEIAFIALGDVFVSCIDTASIDYGKVVRITRTPAPEKDITWSPDGKRLYFSSLRDGNYNIYMVYPRSEDRFTRDYSFAEECVIRGDGTEKEPLISPDGSMIAFKRGKGKLFVKDLKSGKEFRVGNHNDVLWVSWSSDSRWLAYSRTELGPREDVYVVRAKEGAVPVNITDHPNDDYKPMWTKDGKRLFFASRNYEGDWWVKYIFLSEKDFRNKKELLRSIKENDSLRDTLAIEFDGMRDRTITVYRFRAYYNYYTISPNGLYIAVQAEDLNGNDLWIVDHEGKNPRRISKGNLKPIKIEFSNDGEWLAFLSEKGTLYLCDVKKGDYREINLKGDVSISYHDLYRNLLLEGWWMLKDGFYDERMHGVDWEAMFSKYSKYTGFIKTYNEFNNVTYRMLGELNASHLGVWQEYRGKREDFGDLGIVIDNSYEGPGVRVARVIKRSPADVEGIKAGDIILSLDGQKVERERQFAFYLKDKFGEKVAVELLRGYGRKRDTIFINTVSYWTIRDLIYKEWVSRNREIVDSLSGGKFAYLHIRGMGDENYREFEKDIYENRDKIGLILDIRYNGGGHIHDELLNFLRRTHYLVEQERDGLPEYNSLFRWDKPIVLLINEHCFSDAEIFPAGFKKLGLGKVVGVPTFGGVIGTNNYTLFDGKTVFRQPSEGWFYEPYGVSLENTSVEPNIYVENEIVQDNISLDNQLLKAIEVLKEMVGD
ncbi:MAG: S41 family peptidase [bacterium]|nr:S41 family peptidase [bacterium]